MKKKDWCDVTHAEEQGKLVVENFTEPFVKNASYLLQIRVL